MRGREKGCAENEQKEIETHFSLSCIQPEDLFCQRNKNQSRSLVDFYHFELL